MSQRRRTVRPRRRPRHRSPAAFGRRPSSFAAVASGRASPARPRTPWPAASAGSGGVASLPAAEALRSAGGGRRRRRGLGAARAEWRLAGPAATRASAAGRAGRARHAAGARRAAAPGARARARAVRAARACGLTAARWWRSRACCGSAPGGRGCARAARASASPPWARGGATARRRARAARPPAR